MSANTVETFCPVCDHGVAAQLVKCTETFPVYGEPIETVSTVAVCPDCGGVIGDLAVDGKNLDTAFAIYRERHRIPSQAQIRELRQRYGMSVRDFSRFLGFGEQTYASYERGRTPDELHGRMILLASTREGARCIIPLAEGTVSSKAMKLARAFAYPCGAENMENTTEAGDHQGGNEHDGDARQA